MPAGYGIWLLLALPVLYLAVVGVHELGHVVAGRFQNFQFYGLTIGPDVYPAGTHGTLYLEQTLFEAQYRKNLPAAEAALAQYTESPFTEPPSVHLAEASVAALKNDREALAPLLPAIAKALPASMDQSRVVLIKDWLKQWNDLATAP